MAGIVSLSQLLMLKAEYNSDVAEEIKWSQLQKANAAKLARYQKFQTAWQDAYDKAKDGSRSSALKMNGIEFLAKETEATDAQAEQWAYYKAPQYDEELLDELEELDINYESMTALLDAKIEEEKAEIEQTQEQASQDLQDTGMLR